MTNVAKLSVLGVVLLGACSDDGAAHDHNEQEVVTTLTLTFTPDGDGPAVAAAFDDPDGEGGNAPTTDAIALAKDTDYTLQVAFTNKLASPPEDITSEVKAEGDEHQIFFTGTAVKGPASDSGSAVLEHAYNDTDADGHSVGLTNEIKAIAAGTGKLTVTLRHLPPVNDKAVKTATLASDVKTGGVAALPGETDVTATFDVTVQ